MVIRDVLKLQLLVGGDRLLDIVQRDLIDAVAVVGSDRNGEIIAVVDGRVAAGVGRTALAVGDGHCVGILGEGIRVGVRSGVLIHRGGNFRIPAAAVVAGSRLHVGGCSQRAGAVFAPLVVCINQRDIDDLISSRAITPSAVHDNESDLLLVLVGNIVTIAVDRIGDADGMVIRDVLKLQLLVGGDILLDIVQRDLFDAVAGVGSDRNGEITAVLDALVAGGVGRTALAVGDAHRVRILGEGIRIGVGLGVLIHRGGNFRIPAAAVVAGSRLHVGGRSQRTFAVFAPLVIRIKQCDIDVLRSRVITPSAVHDNESDLLLILVRDAVVIFVLLVINFQDVFFGLRAKLLGDDACDAIIDIACRLVVGSISVDGFSNLFGAGDPPSGFFYAVDIVLDGVINLQLAEAIGIGYGVSTGHRRGGGGSIPSAAGLIISGVCLHAGGCVQRTFAVYIPLAVLVQCDKDDLVSGCAIIPSAVYNFESDLLLILVRHTVRAILAVLAAALFVLLVVDVQDVLGRILDERHLAIGRGSRGVNDIVAVCRLLVRGGDHVADFAGAVYRPRIVFYIIYIIVDGVRGAGFFCPLCEQVDVLLLDGVGREVPLRAGCAGVGGVPAGEGIVLPRGIGRLVELVAGLQIVPRIINSRCPIVPIELHRIRRRLPAVLLPDRIQGLGLGLAVAFMEVDLLTFLAGVCARQIGRRACVRVLVPAEERVALARRLIDAHVERILAVVHCDVFPRVRCRNADLLRARVAVVLQRKLIVSRGLWLGLVGVRIPLLIHEVDAALVIGNLDRADRDRGPLYPLVLEDIAVIQGDFISIEPRLARGHIIQPVKPIPVEADAGLPELIDLAVVGDVRADALGLCFRRQSAVLDHEELLRLMQVGQVEAIGEEAVLVAEIVEDTARPALVRVNDQRVRMREVCPVCNHDFRVLLADGHSALVAAAGNRCVAVSDLDIHQIIQVSVNRVKFVVEATIDILVIAVSVDPSISGQLDVDVEGQAGIHRFGDGKILILQIRIVEDRALDHAVAQTVGDNVLRLRLVITDQLILDRDRAYIGDQPDIIGILAGNGYRIRAALPVTGSRDNRSQITGFCVLAIRKQYVAALLADVFAVHIDIDGTSLIFNCSL